MLLSLNFILFLLYFVSSLNGQQDPTKNDDANNFELQPRPPVDERPENLPNATWTILDMDADSRENLCQRQIAYCSNNCGGPNGAPKNFCNSTTMAWNCGCANKVPDLTPYLWPVTQAECIGKAQNCLSICNKKSIASAGACSFACQTYYQCSTEKAPTSYLRTDNPNDIPASYDGPPAPKQSVNNGTSSVNNSTTTGNNSANNDSNQQHSMASISFVTDFNDSFLMILLFFVAFSLV